MPVSIGLDKFVDRRIASWKKGFSSCLGVELGLVLYYEQGEDCELRFSRF